MSKTIFRPLSLGIAAALLLAAVFVVNRTGVFQAWKAAPSLLYVYLTSEGGIFIMHGPGGKETWVSPQELMKELENLKKRGGMVLYSRENPEQDPTPEAERLLDLILRYRLPIRILTDRGSTYRPAEAS